MSQANFVEFLKQKYQTNLIYFDDFMNESLYSEFGFFTKEKIRSEKSGDFLTSPEVSKYFGVIIGNWIKDQNFKTNICELGSGTGSLLDQLKYEKLISIERSLTARNELNKKGYKTFEEINEIQEEKVDLFFGNEILDNIPCSIGIFKEEKWFEKAVLINESKLSYQLVPIREENLNWIKQNEINESEDFEVEIQTRLDHFLFNCLDKFEPRNFLFFDYGFQNHERPMRKYKSLVRTYKDHHLSVNPLDNPSNTDITYDINFSAVKNLFERNGYKVSLKTQREFLFENGYEQIFNKAMLEYSQLEGVEQLILNSEIVGLKAVANENGLGGFYCIEAEKL